MNRKRGRVLLGGLVAILPLVANAQDPRIMQQQAAGAKAPRIEIVRSSNRTGERRVQLRLSDGVVDLMNGVFEGIGNAWKTPIFTETFESRYGRW